MRRWSTKSCIAFAVGVILSSVSSSASEGSATPPDDVVWYVGPGGSADIATCGRTLEAPCDSLQTILDQSPLFGNETFSCYLSGGDGDGRTSTTVNFLQGTNFVPPVCLMGWSNLSIIGLGPPGSVTITSDFSGARAVFNFDQCSNISITNLVFQTAYIGRVTLYFGGTTDITIRNSSFPILVLHSGAIIVQDCSGDVLIENCEIYSDPEFADISISETALQIRQGASSSSTPVMELSAVIKDCTFYDIVSGGDPDDSYSSSHSDGLVIEINFFQGAVDNQVTVQGCSFSHIINVRTSGVLVNFDSGSVNNSVLFVNSTFMNNTVRYGGGIAAYFFANPQDSFLDVVGCNFSNNTANFEGGGVFVAFLSRNVSNAVSISSSTFSENRARYGAGVFLFNNPAWSGGLSSSSNAVALPLVFANITDCEFERNEALLLTEGAINALRIVLTVDGTSHFLNGTGSGIVLRSSLAYFRGSIAFVNNLAITGGGISVQDRSRLDMSEVVNATFTRNTATFSGGAIYADESSTSITADEYNHTLAQNRFGICFAIFGNEFNTNPTPARITFDGNTASLEGDSINAYSLRGCRVSNFVPSAIAAFLAIQSDGTVVYENIASNLTSTSTGPSYLFFYGTSTRCYKVVGDITYLLPNCSHDLLTETFYLLPDLQCGLDAFGREFTSFYGPGAALRPTTDKLITPWAGIETSWTQDPGSTRQGCPESNIGELYLSPAPGEQFDLTVQLADQLLNYVSSTIFVDIEHNLTSVPSVLIQLNGIQYAYTDRVYFTPNRALSGIALVGLPGTEGRLRVVADSQIRGQKITLLIPFKLAQCPLGYYNPPGATTIDEVNELLLQGEFAQTIRIPSDNPLACSCFDSQNLTVTFPNRLLDVPHRCIAGYTAELNSILWAGYIPVRESHTSLADHPARISCPEIPEDATPISDALTLWIMETRASETRINPIAFDPVDVVPYEGDIIPGGGAPVKCFEGSSVSELVDFNPTADSEFSIETCTRGYCRGDIRTSWYLADNDYPCVERREGPLCGQCKPGYALTLYSTTCRDCRDPHTALPVMLTLALGLLFVIVAVVLNIGVSPTVDSVWFFIQSVAIILSGRTDYESFQYLAIFNPDFTFNLCITSTLDGLGRLAGQYITPIYLLLLLCIVLLLTRLKLKGLSRYLGNHSFLRALWLVVLITFINIANITFGIIHCRSVGPLNGTREFVLVDDPSVRCYEGKHLPFAIIAIILAVVVIVPFPFYMIFLMYIPKMKPITDVYCSYYKDRYRAWVWVSLARRLLLVLLGVFIQDTFYRHFYLLIGCIVILVVYVVTWPYQLRVDNHFGFFVTWMLIVLAAITQPDIYIYVDPSRIPSWLLVAVVIVIGTLLIILENYLHLRFQGMTVGKFYMEKIFPHYENLKEMAAERLKRLRKRSESEQELEESTSIIPRISTIDATMFREPLLDSDFSSFDYSSSVNSSVRSTDRRRRQKRQELQIQRREHEERERQERERHEREESERKTTRPTVSVVSSSAGDSDGGFAVMSTYTEVL